MIPPVTLVSSFVAALKMLADETVSEAPEISDETEVELTLAKERVRDGVLRDEFLMVGSG